MALINNPYILIALSVLTHVTWNVLARNADQRANFLWWGLLTHLIILGPLGFWALICLTQWSTTLVMATLVTAAANSSYFISLRHAYRHAPVAVVYPLVRSSPLLIALWSWLIFQTPLSSKEWLAMLVSISGLLLLASSVFKKVSRSVLPWAALAALSTSIYSLSDKVAVLALNSFAEQLGFISIGYFCSFLCLTGLQKVETGHWLPPTRPPVLLTFIGGLCIGSSYALVVRAMIQIPAAHTVAFTNSGIVIAVLLSIFVFHERKHWQRRLFAAILITVGLGLLALFS